MEVPQTLFNPRVTVINASVARKNSDDNGKGNEYVLQNDSFVTDIEAIGSSYQNIKSETVTTKRSLALLEQQKDNFMKRDADMKKVGKDVSGQGNGLLDEKCRAEASFSGREEELLQKLDEEVRQSEKVRLEAEFFREKAVKLEEEKKARDEALERSLDATRAVKQGLVRVIEAVDDEKLGIKLEQGDEAEEGLGLDEETRWIGGELMEARKLAILAEAKVGEYRETRNKEKRELEQSLISLTEENRDINSLLRVALAEKEAAEKSRLRGYGDQKRAPLLQFAERGLQKVGFGFMVSAATNELSFGNSGASVCSKSDGSECEEDGVSLASTVEKIMKNLRLEITQLRKSLEESRSDTERLQTLTEKQAQEIAENTLYTREIEEREALLAQNVGELLREMKETEEEVIRWREACELEVEAGKHTIEEHGQVHKRIY